MTGRSRVAECRPNSVAAMEERLLGKGGVSIRRDEGEKKIVVVNVIHADVVLEKRNRVYGSALVDEHDILAVTMGFCAR